MTATDRALELINDNKIRSGRHFAKLMWPDSPCWEKVYNVGHGATRGVGMWLTGGSFLGKLRHQGLITHSFLGVDYKETITLTSKGRERLLKRKQELAEQTRHEGR